MALRLQRQTWIQGVGRQQLGGGRVHPPGGAVRSSPVAVIGRACCPGLPYAARVLLHGLLHQGCHHGRPLQRGNWTLNEGRP